MRRPLAIASVLLLLGLASCGERTVQVDSIKSQIKQETEKATGGDVTVSCPEDTEAEVGRTFDCDLSADDDTKAKAQVKITKVDEDADPPLQADFNAPLVRTAFIESDIAKTLASSLGDATVQCPTLETVKDPLVLSCQLVNPDRTIKNLVNVTTQGDRFNYRIVAG